MVGVSPKWAALSLLATAAFILTISLDKGGGGGEDSESDLFQNNEQIELLIRTLESRNEESTSTAQIVEAEQGEEEDTEMEPEDEDENFKKNRGKAKSLERWQDHLSGHKTFEGKTDERKMKKQKRLLAEYVDNTSRQRDTNDEDEEDPVSTESDSEKVEHIAVVDMNDPERLRRHQRTPLKELPRDEYWPVVLKPSYGRFFKELNLDHYTREDAEYLRSRMPVYQERAETVSRGCSSRPELLTDTVRIKTLVWDTRHSPNLVWCQLPKIASSSWNADFFSLGHPEEDAEEVEESIGRGDNDKKSKFNLHHEVFRLFPAPNTTVQRNKVFINALRFMVVRHPFVRLVSAYRDKITQDDPKPVWFHYEKLQQLIIEKYRPADSEVEDVHPTFPEFVSFVIDQTRGLKTRQDWKKKVTCWKPYYLSCGVCVHDMQMILKLETLNDDTRFLATLAGLEQLKKKTMWRHHINGTSSDALSLEYFEELTKWQVKQLYQRYKTDFDLFGYSPQEFIDRAQ